MFMLKYGTISRDDTNIWLVQCPGAGHFYVSVSYWNLEMEMGHKQIVTIKQR